MESSHSKQEMEGLDFAQVSKETTDGPTAKVRNNPMRNFTVNEIRPKIETALGAEKNGKYSTNRETKRKKEDVSTLNSEKDISQAKVLECPICLEVYNASEFRVLRQCKHSLCEEVTKGKKKIFAKFCFV
jgi:hypothetical protein